jgi:hypothetical protein
MRALLLILDGFTALGAIFGGLLLVSAFGADASAPQQGALAAMAVALVAIPYCFSGMLHRSVVRDRLKEAAGEIDRRTISDASL